MIGKVIAAATGAAINKEQHGNPLTGAAVGFVTMAVARRFLPARFAVIGATAAAGFLTKKLADRAERRADTEKAIKRAGPAGVADSFALLENGMGLENGIGLENGAGKKRASAKPATKAKRAAPRPKPLAKPKPRAKPARPSLQSAANIKVPEVTH